MPEKISELGNGLELWRVAPNELREQDLNARAQDKATFDQLTSTMKRDKRIESFPLVAKTDKGLEIVSGHHRTRAAVAAGHSHLYCIVDVTGLTPDQIRAKQLAHNSIQGRDNPQILEQIYKAIQDAEARLEAFVDQSIQAPLPKVKIEDVNITIDYRMVSIMFLPTEQKRWKELIDLVSGTQQEVWLAEVAHFKPFQDLAKSVGAEYEIRAMGTILSKVGDLARQAMGIGVETQERVALRDLFKSAYIPKEAAVVVRKAIQAMTQDGTITEKNQWQALEYLAAEYLSGHNSGA